MTSEALDEQQPRRLSPSLAILRLICHGGLFLGLLCSNVGQRIAFKRLGYGLGPYPYFVLITISGTFVLIFGAICAVITAATGGWLPETRTWRVLFTFGVIGFCNALQGAGMVFANPYVPGYLQALLQQGVIPFTLMASVLWLRARFSLQQHAGVLLIVVGIGMQLLPDVLKGGADDAGEQHAAVSSWLWSLLFLGAQLPVAVAAILQERAFKAVPVNVFQMMYWASVSQFLSLTFLSPMDTIQAVGDSSSVGGFLQNFREAWRIVRTDAEVGGALVACVVAMLLAQLTQALMVKHSSASFTVLCMAFVVPASALAFTLPCIVGEKTVERMSGSTPAALLFVFCGIMSYRLGDQSVIVQAAITPVPTPIAEPLLSDGDLASPPVPKICTAGVGIIASEYTNSRHSDLSIWEECTLKDGK